MRRDLIRSVSGAVFAVALVAGLVSAGSFLTSPDGSAVIARARAIETSREVTGRDGRLLNPFAIEDGRRRLKADLDNVAPRFGDMPIAHEGQRFRPHARLDIGVALHRIGMHDIGVADIDDPHVAGQVGHVVLVVIAPGMADAEQRRRLAHVPWPESCPRPPSRAETERRADNGGIVLDRGPVSHRGAPVGVPVTQLTQPTIHTC